MNIKNLKGGENVTKKEKSMFILILTSVIAILTMAVTIVVTSVMSDMRVLGIGIVIIILEFIIGALVDYLVNVRNKS